MRPRSALSSSQVWYACVASVDGVEVPPPIQLMGWPAPQQLQLFSLAFSLNFLSKFLKSLKKNLRDLGGESVFGLQT